MPSSTSLVQILLDPPETKTALQMLKKTILKDYPAILEAYNFIIWQMHHEVCKCCRSTIKTSAKALKNLIMQRSLLRPWAGKVPSSLPSFFPAFLFPFRRCTHAPSKACLQPPIA